MLGFISIDCGLPENSNYTEKFTGINYISDAEFIDTGVTKSISPAENITHQQQLHFVRSFPSGVRNCYKINVNIGLQYLIRASFYYGNYDNLNDPPQFDLHFGPNIWDTVNLLSNTSRITIKEIIYIPSKDYIQPCLVNTGNGTPFISAIELRILNNDSYIRESIKPVVLSLFRRYDLGSITNLEYRYKDDVYDRIWSPYESSSDWRRLSTSLSNDDQTDYKPPAIVMSTAITPVNASAPLQFSYDADNVNDKYYNYLHFNEVEKLTGNETRAFDITLNDNFFYSRPFRNTYGDIWTVYDKRPYTGAARYRFSLQKKENSTLPPILNAIEIYKVNNFSQSETQHDDVDTITNIKNAYGVTRNWQGDPCAPVNYMWEGLNCSIDDGNNPPRITSLNLSSSGLTGKITSFISKLTMLECLDLSNNRLDGPLPDFLIQLQSLKVLQVLC